VGAYVLLMTDAYPPFRLDQGGDEPAPSTPPPASGPPSAPTPTTAGVTPVAPVARHWTTLRIVGLAAGSVLLATALVSCHAGTALLVADKALRDDGGFLMSGGERFSTTSYAVASGTVELGSGGIAHAVVGDVRLTVHGSRRPVFIGIASTRDVDAYLTGVAHRVVTDFRAGAPHYRQVPGGAPAAAPADALAWEAYATGEGTQTLQWNAGGGRWTAVLMNADGSPRVSAVVAAGATLPVVGWGAATLLVGAVLLAVAGLVLVLVALPRPPTQIPPSAPGSPAQPGLSEAMP
jgi:hypothetical protein